MTKGGFLRVRIYLEVDLFCTEVSSVHSTREAINEGAAAVVGADFI